MLDLVAPCRSLGRIFVSKVLYVRFARTLELDALNNVPLMWISTLLCYSSSILVNEINQPSISVKQRVMTLWYQILNILDSAT